MGDEDGMYGYASFMREKNLIIHGVTHGAKTNTTDIESRTIALIMRDALNQPIFNLDARF